MNKKIINICITSQMSRFRFAPALAPLPQHESDRAHPPPLLLVPRRPPGFPFLPPACSARAWGTCSHYLTRSLSPPPSRKTFPCVSRLPSQILIRFTAPSPAWGMCSHSLSTCISLRLCPIQDTINSFLGPLAPSQPVKLGSHTRCSEDPSMSHL